MNTFSKYYTIKEYTFFEHTTISHIEFYISHSIHNTTSPPTAQSFKITIMKNGVNTSIVNKSYNNISVGSVVSNQSLDTTLIFNQTDKVSIQLTLNNTSNLFKPSYAFTYTQNDYITTGNTTLPSYYSSVDSNLFNSLNGGLTHNGSNMNNPYDFIDPDNPAINYVGLNILNLHYA